jgi:anti-anti-sigma factor
VSNLEISALTGEGSFRLAGDLDFSTLPRLTQSLGMVPPGEALRLDLANVIHVDSAGLHAILGLARSRSLTLLNPTPTVMRSFEIAGIDLHPAIDIRHEGVSSAPRDADSREGELRRTG